MVVPIAMHPTNKNSVIVFDLMQDPAILLDLGAKTLAERLYTSVDDLPEGTERPALKQLIANKCPVVSPTSTLNGEAAKRLNIDIMLCKQHRQTLQNTLRDIQPKIAKIFAPREFEPVTDPDLMIYGGGFFHDKDKTLMDTIHNTVSETGPEELATQTWTFKDKRLPEMLFRFRARNYPETLNEDEQAQWLEHCRERLVSGESGFLNFEQLYAEIAELRNEMELDEHKTQLLADVEAFGRELEAYVKA